MLQSHGGEVLAVSADGPFTFATKQPRGTPAMVTVKQQPTGPAQTCTVTQSSTSTLEGDVSDVRVACVTQAFKVGGTVMGLEGTGLRLRLNDASELEVAQNGAFQFDSAIPSGATFTVTVHSQPSSPTQSCEVVGGSGTVGAAEVSSVAINCSTRSFVVGGTVSGLVGTGLVLQNNLGNDLSVTANGTFGFSSPVLSGGAFAVTVKSQPSAPAQTCTIASGEGSVGAGEVTTVSVVCATNTYAVGGTVSGLEGSGLVLQNNLGDNLPITAGGSFTFATPVASGSAYSVTVLSQPSALSQTCTVSAGSGAIDTAPVTNVQVTCVTNAYTVGGSVSGLAGSGLVLRNNGGDALSISADGAFTFPQSLLSGASFAVTVDAQPSEPEQTCTVSGGSGSVVSANVTSVAINCVTNTYTVGGSVSGLAGSGLSLALNGGTPLALSANGTYAFPGPLPSGTDYTLSIVSQPTSPWQTCSFTGSTRGTVTDADITDVAVSCVTNTYSVGGSVSGLAGGGLVLTNNGGDALSISADGTFTFPTQVASGQAYSVAVSAQPTSPWQTCTVSSAAGSLMGGDITNVRVTCTTNEYAIGGTLSGLEGTLVLKNNGGDDLTLNANGTFTFPTPVASGSGYAVTIATQPSSPSQTCTVSSGSGTVSSAAVTSVSVTCVTNTFSVGGSVSGLAGSGLVLTNNGGDDLTLSADGTFTFSTKVASARTYSVGIKTQPTSPWQSCTVTGGEGTVGASDVTSVSVNCTTNAYAVGGTVSGLEGTGLVLQNNGGDDLSLSGSGSFSFATLVASGGAYNVTVKDHPRSPWQTCVVTNGSGTVGGANVTSIEVACTTNTYNVQVTVSGLAGSGLVLQQGGADNLSIPASGTFTFATQVASGAAYNVTVLTQPTSPWQSCTVASPTGTVAGTDVTLSVACVTRTYTVGGTVSGLEGSGLVLQNNGGDDLSISADGTFSFATPVASGATYSVSVSTQPTGPQQYCQVSSGSGTVAGADVTDVAITCFTTMGLVWDVSGATSGVWYVPCGDGTASNCTQAVAESSCTAFGRKLVSHASDGTSSVVSLGATTSCQWSISYFTNSAASVAGQCLIGISNASWNGSCCPSTMWHGNIVNIPTTLGEQFGYVDASNSGYDAAKTNAPGVNWGCFENTAPPPDVTGCSVYNVACK